jgi:prepilin-type N-terminal cleavage/methylation domain-containing protein
MKSRINESAFTLIELLVVIAIIALLMAVVVPSLRKAKDAAKVMICASNQHQCLMGVLGYATSNDGVMPPAIMKTSDDMARAGTPHSWPNCLNYHADNPVADNSGATYTYLGDYLPSANVFMCPMAPGRVEEVQDRYENPTRPGGSSILVSYNMFWGGVEFPTIELVGPTGKGGNRKASSLMLSDVMSYWGRGSQDLWWVSHRPEKGDMVKLDYDPLAGGINIEMLWTYLGSVNDVPKIHRMNAGYSDGSVNRYSAEETIQAQSPGYDHLFYFPSKWR